MYEKSKKVLITLFAVIFAAVLVTPAISFGDTSFEGSAEDATENSQMADPENTASESEDVSIEILGPMIAEGTEAASAPSSEATESEASAEDGSQEKAGDCTLTLEYYENVTYEDPEKPAEHDGRRLMGSRTLAGFSEGDYINTWDYVVNIPGYFFFDAWPARLNISTNPDENLIQLFYVRLWNSEYTVNYYLMANADLSADTWGEVLEGHPLFYKMGSQTFSNQPFDMLVEGDAYEYSLNGLYVIDTYPAKIRLGEDTDNNVINVLYTTEISTLPDSVEIPDDIQPPGTLPDDEIFDKDDLIPTLPDDGNTGIYDDFLGSAADRGELEITDEMLANPVDKDQATLVSNAYQSGVLQGEALVQTGDIEKLAVPIAVAVAAAAVIVFSLFMYWRKRRQEA